MILLVRYNAVPLRKWAAFESPVSFEEGESANEAPYIRAALPRKTGPHA